MYFGNMLEILIFIDCVFFFYLSKSIKIIVPSTRGRSRFPTRDEKASRPPFLLSPSLSFFFHRAAVMLIFPEKGRILEPNAFVLSSR